MAIFLALVCAVTYGAGDFFGGSAARRVHPFAVGWLSHSLVVFPVAGAAVLVGAGSVAQRDLLWGAIGGILGAAALLALYAGLARGPMTIVAPTTALVAASLPVVVGSVLQDEYHSDGQWAGIALALIAIVAVSLRPDDGEPAPDDGEPAPDAGGISLDPTTLGLAVLAGAGFGIFFIALDRTSADAGLWPLVSGRLISAGLFTALVLTVKPFRQRVITHELRPNLPIIAAAATLDVAANVFYLLANRRGDLSTVAVLSSLYPASTIVLANRVLGERIGRVQAFGMVLAVIAVALVAAG